MGDTRHDCSPQRMHGYSLVELMITIAVLSVVAAIAVPAYTGYIREGHFATMRTTIDGMRTVLEDFRLDNGSYVPAGNSVGDELATADIISKFGWEPSGDLGSYTYTVSVATSSYDVWGVYSPSAWVRCDDRFTTCCDADTGAAVTAACP